LDQPLRHARSPSFLNSTEFPILQQAAHLRLKVALPKLPADLKFFVTEAGETVPHPVLAVPSGIVMHDWNAREVPLEQGQLIRSHSSHGVASAPVIGVDVWLVTPLAFPWCMSPCFPRGGTYFRHQDRLGCR
jgi:hypothetical protein